MSFDRYDISSLEWSEIPASSFLLRRRRQTFGGDPTRCYRHDTANSLRLQEFPRLGLIGVRARCVTRRPPGYTPIRVRVGVRRIQLDRLVEIGNRFFELLQAVVGKPARIEGRRQKRVEFHRLRERLDGLGEVLLLDQLAPLLLVLGRGDRGLDRRRCRQRRGDRFRRLWGLDYLRRRGGRSRSWSRSLRLHWSGRGGGHPRKPAHGNPKTGNSRV